VSPNPAAASIKVLAASGEYLLAGTQNSGLFLSLDRGVSWRQVSSGLPNVEVLAVTIDPAFVQRPDPVGSGNRAAFVVATRVGVFVSYDFGRTWNEFNDGLTNTFIRAVCVSRGNVYAGTIGSGVWSRSLLEIQTTYSKTSESEAPERFVLEQNYPNPFNPITIINFQLPIDNYVTLKVYDVLGREVATLVNEELKQGEHETTFSAAGLSSGTYFFRLTMGNLTDVKKMIVMK
jgi:hypothetical protein